MPDREARMLLTPYVFLVIIDGQEFRDRHDALTFARQLGDFVLSPPKLDEHMQRIADMEGTTKFLAFEEYVYALPPIRVTFQ